jgi:hypothetical protein
VTRIDHIILAVADLDAAARSLRERTGLAAIPGGTHPDWGTANAVVPLRGAYLELVTVADPAVAAGTAFGRAVAAAGDGALAGWAVGVDDVDAVADRLGVAVVRGRRAVTGGGTLSWAMVGVEEALPRDLPFFLRWDDARANPARAAAPHDVEPLGVAWVETGGDATALAAWLGPHDLDVRAVPGAPPGLRRAAIALRDGREILVSDTAIW